MTNMTVMKAAGALRARCNTPHGLPTRTPPFSSGQHQCRRRAITVAALSPETAAAVAQQAAFFAATSTAEGIFSRSKIPSSDPGYPSIPLIGAGVGGCIAAAALTSQGGGGPLSSVGLVVGVVSCAALIFINIKRASDLEYTDNDFPGPKAWPAGMTLLSFFALSAFFQALVQDITTPGI